jgi:RNA polymerase sigma-70 factor (ECF subfamily)
VVVKAFARESPGARVPGRAAEQGGGPMAAAMATTVDEQWFLHVYRRTAAALRTYAARVLGSVTEADDIVQETYLRFVRSPPAIDDVQQVRAFLFRIASRLIVDQWRRRQRERSRMIGRPSAETGTRTDLPLRLDMARVFGHLGTQERQLLWLAYVEGADHREIAAALGLAERSVRVLLYRARHKLARLLQQAGQGLGEP